MLTSTRRRSANGGGHRVFVASVAAVIAVFALAGIGTAILAASTSAGAPGSSGQGAQSDPLVRGLAQSHPQRVRIPAIGVDSPLAVLGLQHDQKTMELPTAADQIGWYNGSVTPGEGGTAIIAGYIQDGRQPGVLANLADLKKGQDITVDRKDGTAAVFTVDRIEQYPHGTFPATQVYAASNNPTLRIVTVGGTLHPDDQPGNVVVYTHLSAVHHGDT